MKKVLLIVTAIVGLILTGCLLPKPPPRAAEPPKPIVAPGPLDEFAKCVASSGAVFYGADYDVFTENQRLIFNKSAGLLKYVNCDPNMTGQLSPECLVANIQEPATWVFGDGAVEPGTFQLPYIAERTGCTLPQDTGEAYYHHALISLAKCLTKKPVVLFGHNRCGYCQLQQDIFENAKEFLTYIDCGASPEALAECRQVGIAAFPTWYFSVDKTVEGLQTLQELSNLSGCPWPVWE